MKNNIIDTVTGFFEWLNDRSIKSVDIFWNTNGTIFINNKNNKIEFFNTLPNLLSFNIIEMSTLSEDKNIGSVKVVWEMIMPNNIGKHISYLNCIIENNEWKIVSMIDYGIEE